MVVRELIEKLQGIPGDYHVGTYFVPTLSEPKFKALEPTVGLNNEARRVTLGFGRSFPASMQELRDTTNV